MRARAVLLTSLALVGCGGGTGIVNIVGGHASVYECGQLAFTADELEAAPPADELGAEGRAALEHAAGPIDPADGWSVLADSDDELAMIRELDQPDLTGPGDLRTHEFVRMEIISGVTDVPDGEWMLDAQGICTPRLDLGRLGQADLVLPAEPPRDATEFDLEVHERACASGESADGRVELVRMELTTDELRLVIGVRPAEGDQDCPGNPPTPLTIRLDEPLGERQIVDASTLPPQPLA